VLRNTWHGVLTPLAGSGLFAVIDRIGPGANLEEHHLADPWTVG
ncbi:MAG: ureidoglycolate lyase, partial [Gemmobacter sp.]